MTTKTDLARLWREVTGGNRWPSDVDAFIDAWLAQEHREKAPIDMVLHCPACGLQHIDAPEPSMMAGDAAMFGGDWPDRWTNPPHRSHLCKGCSHVWRPADVPTNGVAAVKTRGRNDRVPRPVPAAPSAGGGGE